jgi:hypothetical protein
MTSPFNKSPAPRTPLRASYRRGAPTPSATRGSPADEGVGPTTESNAVALMTVRGPRPIPAGEDAYPTANHVGQASWAVQVYFRSPLVLTEPRLEGAVTNAPSCHRATAQ